MINSFQCGMSKNLDLVTIYSEWRDDPVMIIAKLTDTSARSIIQNYQFNTSTYLLRYVK